MKPAEYRKQKKRVQRSIDRWHTVLGLKWWKVDYVWYDSQKQFAKGLADPTYAHDVAARTWTDWRYRSATISFSVPKVATMTDDEVENMVIHEMVHVLVGSLSARGNKEHVADHAEFVTTSLAHAFEWVRRADA